MPKAPTVMEYTAEDLIAHKLQRGGILVAKPKFDQHGADLLGLVKVDDGAKFCRIQCKGRTIVNQSAHVDVFPEYVTDAFVLCLFVETGEPDATNLFAFFAGEIRKWKKTTRDGRDVYYLGVTKQALDEWTVYHLSGSRVNLIKRLIEHADDTGEFALLTTGRIDQTLPFLE